MTNGFKVICQSCGNEVILKSERDSSMGFNSSDIYSNNTSLIRFSNERKTVIIECKCGNIITDS
ncbi:hypothetical protein D3C76_1634850 [compost metagenome]